MANERNLQKEFLQILLDDAMWIGDNLSRIGDEERQIIEADDFEGIAKKMAELAEEVAVEAFKKGKNDGWSEGWEEASDEFRDGF